MTFDAIVLAAGASSRFGGGKLLAPWRGGVLLDGALGAAFAAPAERVTVVWGADDRAPTAAAAFAAAAGEGSRLRLVHATRSAEGMAQSLKAGISSLEASSAGAFIFLGDMPLTPHALFPALATALATGAEAAAPTFKERRGHPVLVSAALYAALMNLSGDRGAAAVLASLGDRLALIPCDDVGVLLDVDRPADLPGD